MTTYTISYNAKWHLKDNPNYQFTECGKCFNSMTGKEVKRVVKGYSVGFNIAGKFITLKNLRSKLELIQTSLTPF